MIATLVAVTVKGSLLLVAALVATRLLRAHSASLRHAVWSAAVLGQLALLALAFLLPASFAFTVPTPAALAPALQPAAPGATRAAPDDTETGSARSIAPPPLSAIPDDQLLSDAAGPRPSETWNAGAAPVGAAPTHAAAATAAAAPAGASAGGTSWATLAGALWGIGALLFLTRLALGTATVTRLARRAQRVTEGAWLSLSHRIAGDMGISRPLALLRGDGLEVPVTWGVVYPAVLLPAEADEWSGDRRRLVLLHELAHVKRFDALTQRAAQVVLALCWYNPLFWLAVKAMHAESERACDDYVLRGGAEPSNYVHELIAMVRAMRPAAPAYASLAMARRTEFEGLMLAILDARANRRGLGSRAGALTAAAALCLIVPLAAMRPAGAPASPVMTSVPEYPIDDAPEAPRPAGEGRAAAGWQAAGDTDRVHADVDKDVDVDTDVDVNTNVDVHADARVQVNAGMPREMQKRMERQAERAGKAAARVQERLMRQREGGAAMDLAVPPLIDALGDREVQVRATAVSALGSLGDPRAVEALARALRTDTDARVREMAAHALGEIEDPRAVPALAAAVREDREAAVRNKAAWALGEIEDGAGVEALTAALRDANVDVRRTAVWALGEIEDPRAVPALAPLLGSEDVETRKQAAWALGEIESAQAVEPLAAALKDENPSVREMVVWALGEIEDVRALPALTGALRDPEVGVRRKAVWALGELDGLEKAPQGLIDALKDADRQVRKTAAWAVGEIEDPAAVPGLVVLTRDQDTDVRRTAAHALSEIRGPAALEALIAMLKDEDPEMRKMAAQALGRDH